MEYDVKYDELLHKDDIYITFSQIVTVHTGIQERGDEDSDKRGI